MSQFVCEHLEEKLDNLRHIAPTMEAFIDSYPPQTKTNPVRAQTIPTKVGLLMESFMGIVAFAHSSQGVPYVFSEFEK